MQGFHGASIREEFPFLFVSYFISCIFFILLYSRLDHSLSVSLYLFLCLSISLYLSHTYTYTHMNTLSPSPFLFHPFSLSFYFFFSFYSPSSSSSYLVVIFSPTTPPASLLKEMTLPTRKFIVYAKSIDDMHFRVATFPCRTHDRYAYLSLSFSLSVFLSLSLFLYVLTTCVTLTIRLSNTNVPTRVSFRFFYFLLSSIYPPPTRSSLPRPLPPSSKFDLPVETQRRIPRVLGTRNAVLREFMLI